MECDLCASMSATAGGMLECVSTGDAMRSAVLLLSL